jgi:hypothetical protein
MKKSILAMGFFIGYFWSNRTADLDLPANTKVGGSISELHAQEFIPSMK